MVEAKSRQIRIDGRPVMIMCGELHYFPLLREQWRDRVAKPKKTGCNAVAS